ncbi:two-component sensor histidine kinase [Candidatus Nitrotoga sp. AM1P]|nr:two-component sensor histidine kinase [Candidatus Nitrotoga sp. AM1P]
MMASLQHRLSLWIAVLIVAVSVVAGGFSFWLAFDEAHELQDEQLRQVAALMDVNDLLPMPVSNDRAVSNYPDTRVFIFRLGTHTDAKHTELQMVGLLNDLADGMHTVSDRQNEWRVVIRTLPNGDRIAVGQRTAMRDEIARDGALRTVLPLIGLVPLLIVLIGFVIRHTFRPVMCLSKDLDEKGDKNLIPLSGDGIPKEILPFVESINRLLARLTLSMAQQRRFVADAAHELRSPITALTLQAENIERADMSIEARQRLAPLKAGLVRARSLIEQLLSLAKHQVNQTTDVEIVAFDMIVREVVKELYPLAEAKHIDLGIEREEPIRLRGGAFDFLTLTRNALDNAIRYTPVNGKVDVSFFLEGNRMVFRVEDSGPGIPEDELLRVFDPFYRIAASGETGTGLGLSIVRDIARRLNGIATLSNINNAGRSGLRFQYSQSLTIY